MKPDKRILNKTLPSLLAIPLIYLAGGSLSCSTPAPGVGGSLPTAMNQVPAVRLNYRYEADVPAPTEPAKQPADQRNAAVQSDFDQRRTDEVLDKTITSPDAKRVVAVYHKVNDLPSEYRLDMYSADGKLLRKMTSDLMAVHFPDTIRWSPNSANVAFVAMIRGAQPEQPSASPTPGGEPTPANSNANANVNADPEGTSNTADTNSNTEANTAVLEPTPAPPSGILTFRTEQLYLANADGAGVKPITQNDGLIYFYYDWAPDSSALAALAATQREWQVLQFRAESNGEIFIPLGRPRIIEPNGRERRLDDALTAVHPVWSPDSSKIAGAYDTQIRIYDASGVTPTQAAIPLRNQLLLSSQAFDRAQAEKLNAPVEPMTSDQSNVNTNANSAQDPATLPDPSTLASFNPIVGLSWPEDAILYFQTAYIKRMKKESDSVTSFPRWHRLILSPQHVTTK